MGPPKCGGLNRLVPDSDACDLRFLPEQMMTNSNLTFSNDSVVFRHQQFVN